jgi:hypothetical protein
MTMSCPPPADERRRLASIAALRKLAIDAGLYRPGWDGTFSCSYSDLAFLLTHHPGWKEVIRCESTVYDDLQKTLMKAPPFAKDYASADAGYPRPLSDNDITRICIWLEREYEIYAKPKRVRRVVQLVNGHLPPIPSK